MNAISATPDQASADASVAATTIASTTRKIVPRKRNSARTNRATARSASATLESCEAIGDLHEQVAKVHGRDPDDQAHGGDGGHEGPDRDQHAAGGGAIANDQEREVGARRDDIHQHQAKAEHDIAPEQPAAPGHEPLQRELGRALEVVERERLALDWAGGVVSRDQHADRAAFDEKREDRAADEDQAECRRRRPRAQPVRQ